MDRIKWLAPAIFVHAVATGNCENNPIRDAKVLGKTPFNGETKSYNLEKIENVISAWVENIAAQLVMALSNFASLRKADMVGIMERILGNGVRFKTLDDPFSGHL